MLAGSGDESKHNGTHGLKQYSDKVDLNDLDWEDRERVLRLLFSKMNAGIPTNASQIQAKQMMQADRAMSNSQVHQMLEYSALPAEQEANRQQ